MTDAKRRQLVRDLLRAFRRALPALREADRAFRALLAEKPAPAPARKPGRKAVPGG